MEYSNYYPTLAHPPLSVSSHLHGGHHHQMQHHQQPSPNGQMLSHSPIQQQNLRQTITPSPHQSQQIHVNMSSQHHQNLPHHHHQQQQQQQPSMNQSQQHQQHQQQQQHHHQHQTSYHAMHTHPPVTPSPLSSPHGQTHHNHNHHHHHQQHHQQQTINSNSIPQHQTPLTSPHMHSQSPHGHHVTSPIHIQQPLNQLASRPPQSTSSMNHVQHGHQQSSMHHHQQQPQQQHHSQGYYSNNISQSNLTGYQQHQSNHHQQTQQHQFQRQQAPSMQHTPPLPTHATSASSNQASYQISGHGVSRTLTPQHYNIPQAEMRVLEFNRRLQCRPVARQLTNPLPHAVDDNHWWDKLISEFFEDDATLTLRTHEERPMIYTFSRRLIPRFFKSFFDGGVTEFSISLRLAKEVQSSPQMITLDCDQASIVTKNTLRHPSTGPNIGLMIHSEGRLLVEFVNNSDTLTIKSWQYHTKYFQEYIDRTAIKSMGASNNNLTESLTRSGLPEATQSFLKMFRVIESMQDIMSQYKQTNMDPRMCLRKLLYDRYNFKCEDESKVVPNKQRRKRKAPSAAPPSTASPVSTMSKKTKVNNTNNIATVPSPKDTMQSLQLASHDVGEPTMMGCDFSDDNERLITRLENSQYDPSIIESTRSIEDPIQSNESSANSNLFNVDSNQDKNQAPPTVTTVSVPVSANKQQLRSVSTSPPQLQSQENQTEPIVNNTALEVQSSPPSKLVDEPQHPSNPISSQNVDTSDSKNVNESNILDKESKELEKPQSQSTGTQSDEDNQPAQNHQQSQVTHEISNVEIQTSKDETQSSQEEKSNEKENQQQPVNVKEELRISISEPSSDSMGSKLPSGTGSKSITPTNGTSSNKQNRRRSSERKETLREGLMRTSDFVVALKDLKSEHPALWRITTGNNLLQQFEPKTQSGVVLYENTNQYAGWNPEIKRDYIGVDVRLTQHTRNQITVERLLLNFQQLDDVEAFYDKHFAVYLQILISTALDPRFWEGIEGDSKHQDYFVTSKKIIDDTTKRHKLKISCKLKLTDVTMKNIEKYPNLYIHAIDQELKAQLCKNCNTNTSTQSITFGNRSYDLHSFKSVKVTNGPGIESTDEEQRINLCDSCLELVKIYSEIHHIGWKFFKLASKKVEKHLVAGKPINTILDECLKDEDWMAKVYAERDTLWSKVEQAAR